MTNLARLTVAACFAASAALPSQAALFRSYLASDGNDANPCTLVQPCRLLPAALAAVAPGGEVWMLDSANYNTSFVSVDKAVTILAVPGALGSVLSIGGAAVLVNASGVTLRNLNIRPLTGDEAGTGIVVNGTYAATLLDTDVSGFTSGLGILVGDGASVTIDRCRFRDNNIGVRAFGGHTGISGSLFSGNTGTAVLAYSNISPATVSFTRSVARNNSVALSAQSSTASGTARLLVSESRVEANHTGITVSADGSSRSRATIVGTVIDAGQTGIHLVGAGALAHLSGTTITHAVTGILNFEAVVESAGNNNVRGNTFNTDGTITPVGSI